MRRQSNGQERQPNGQERKYETRSFKENRYVNKRYEEKTLSEDFRWNRTFKDAVKGNRRGLGEQRFSSNQEAMTMQWYPNTGVGRSSFPVKVVEEEVLPEFPAIDRILGLGEKGGPTEEERREVGGTPSFKLHREKERVVSGGRGKFQKEDDLMWAKEKGWDSGLTGT
ncbi:hypothetical protein LWI29_029077 [Acer saccharum]|uniref:Uncharacterized protein n=1 Tax=Acer saccharum TaxID=4024 RepID=A0AA39S5B2_ACESA|nr:hypothetical protein LWI29_029077 [Acer saccharum]